LDNILEPNPAPWPKPSDRDWKEDGQQYMNLCVGCGLAFTGHKRRVQCKVCAPGVKAFQPHIACKGSPGECAHNGACMYACGVKREEPK
jgi:hypothetical protein